MPATLIGSVRSRGTPASWTPWTSRSAEIGALALFFGVTATTFPGDAVLLYGLAGYYCVGVWVHRQAIGRVLQSGLVLWLLPLWALASALWSVEPIHSLRGALQLALTVIICVQVVARLSPRDAILAVFFAGLAILAISLPSFLTLSSAAGPFAGVFDQKNHLAKRLGTFAFAATAIVCDRRSEAGLRLIAGAAGLLAGAVLIATQSATGWVSGALGVGLVIAVALAWRSARGARGLVLSGALAMAALGTLLVVNLPRSDVSGAAFSALGKDRTFTGRTALWLAAQRQIERRPLLGLGHNAFWRPSRLDAQGLLEANDKPRGAPFSFHNAYLEISVTLGWIGLAFGVLGLVWATACITAWAFLQPSAASGFFLACAATALVRSFVESDLFSQFEAIQMLVWIGGLYAAGAVARTAAPAAAFVHGGPKEDARAW